MSNKNTYIPVIGLEVHVELNTLSKVFCGCDNNWFGATPNTHTCPVCLGLPGALPVPNKKAIESCIKIGMALNCEIPLLSKFDRKNYFYPDLAKGYQISQYDQPFAENGWIEISTPVIPASSGARSGFARKAGIQETSGSPIRSGMTKRIRIRRVHMEEDTGKLMHATVNGEHVSLIDFNRSGSPLVEIVTEPDFSSSDEVKEYLQKLQQIVRFLGVADADMEKGGMRLEPNISLRPVISNEVRDLPTKEISRNARNDTLPNYKVEVKNINSFNFVSQAIEYEIKRHAEILEKGEIPKQETRGWDEDKKMTISQRSKEEAADYRYFPEPDIPPFVWTKDYVESLRKEIPELPDVKIEKFVKDYGLSEYNAQLLTKTPELASYFEECVRVAASLSHPEQAVIPASSGARSGFARKAGIQETSGSPIRSGMTKGNDSDITPTKIANVIINKKVDIEKVLPAKLIEDLRAAEITNEVSSEELVNILKPILSQNEKVVSDYKAGKTNAIMFFVGQVMRELKGKAKADTVKETLEKLLA